MSKLEFSHFCTLLYFLWQLGRSTAAERGTIFGKSPKVSVALSLFSKDVAVLL